MTSLKSAWAIVENNSPAEVIYKTCRPRPHKGGPPEADFEVVYELYRFENGHWAPESQREVGFWEYERSLDYGEFLSRFPHDQR
jgi:hypothetical protein